MFNILEKSLIFNNFFEKEIEKTLANVKYVIKSYAKGENIAFRGDEVKNLSIIIKGKVVTEMLGKNGEIRKIENLGESDVLAAAFIFGDENMFPVDIRAVQDVDILNIPKKEFLKLLTFDKKILENFLNEISNKTQILSSKIWTSINNRTISEKLNDYIQKNYSNSEINIPSLKSLAESFGITRPSLSRVLINYVKEEKLKRIGKNKYIILDKNFFNI